LWEFTHDCWLIRNDKEHDKDGNPESRKKVKLIETIQNKAKKWKYGIYGRNELDTNKLIKLPSKNITMLLENIKNGRRNDKTKIHDIL
jgi:hypothetical protein